MIALLLLMTEPNIINQPVQTTPVTQSAPEWIGQSRNLTNPNELTVPHVGTYNPNEVLYEKSNLCVYTNENQTPACAAAKQETLVLSEDMFSENSIAGSEATCQTVETIRRDANGSPKRVYANVCGEEPSRADFKDVDIPQGQRHATRPTQRAIGPNQIVGAAVQ